MPRPKPTSDEPTIATLMSWARDGGCRATDGCWLQDDRLECPHGHPAWAVILGKEPRDA